MVRVVRLELAYDGTDFAGWQAQREGIRTVQGEVERQLATILREKVTVQGSSRTDAGVHALGQAASFTTSSPMPAETIFRALRATLPKDVAVLSACDAPVTFHARFSARGKVYRYLVESGPTASPFLRRYAWYLHRRLDQEAMKEAAEHLVGRHDFSSFAGMCGDARDPVKTISRCEVLGRAGRLHFLVEGNGFLYHMVRTIVGTLSEVGAGRRPPGDIPAILAACDRRRAGVTAPAHGLFLVRVLY